MIILLGTHDNIIPGSGPLSRRNAGVAPSMLGTRVYEKGTGMYEGVREGYEGVRVGYEGVRDDYGGVRAG